MSNPANRKYRKPRDEMAKIVLSRIGDVLMPLGFQQKGETFLQEQEDVLLLVFLGRGGWKEWLHIQPIVGLFSLLIARNEALVSPRAHDERNQRVINSSLECRWLDCHWMRSLGLLMSDAPKAAKNGKLCKFDEVYGRLWRASNEEQADEVGCVLGNALTTYGLPALQEIITPQKLRLRLKADMEPYEQAWPNSLYIEVLDLVLDERLQGSTKFKRDELPCLN